MKKIEILKTKVRLLTESHRVVVGNLVRMVLVALLAIFLTCERGFSQTLYGWEVSGVSANTATLNATTSALNISGGQLSLTGLSASASAGTFGGTGWNLTNTFDETNDYFSFTVTPSVGYEVAYSSLQWTQGVTTTAPNTSRWGYKVGTGAFTLQAPFNSANSDDATWDFTDFNATETVEFRFWTYGATSVGSGGSQSGGASRIRSLTGNDLILYGSVAAIVPVGASMYWSADGAALGGVGTWNATNTNWSANASPVSGVTWNATKSAVFQGTAATITVGTVSVAEGLLFGTTGYTLSSGTINLSGAAAANNTITTQPSVTATISSSLAGSSALTKSGDGTLILSGSSSYTGGTSISAGTLQIGAGSTTGSIDGTIANNGTLITNRSDNLTLGSVISGTGSLSNSGSGSLTLSGSNTYSGGTTLSAGTLKLGHDNALGTGNLSTTASVTIASADSSARTISANYSGISGSAVTITFGEASGGTGNLIFAGAAGPSLGTGTRTFNVLNSSTFQAGLSGGSGGTLTKTGSGTLILAGNNTYTGNTSINTGTLQIGNGGTSGALSTSSNITVNGTLAFNRSNDVNQGTDFKSSVGISGTGSLVQMGTGNLTLNVANTYSGGTTLNTGTLVIGHASAAGSGTITQTDATSLLKIDTTGTIANAMIVYNVLATQSATLNGAIMVNNASFEVDAGDVLTISGNVSGSGGVTKNGAGKITLNGTNSYSGATVVNSGTLEAASTHALGSNTTINVNGGTLLVSANSSINGMNITLGNNTTSTVGTLSFNSDYSGNIGTLTLSANSILDMGNYNIGAEFADLAMGLYNTLRIYNWSGTTLWGGGTGADQDRIYFRNRNLTESELGRISFYSDFGSSFLGTGFDLGLSNQIIPVPEPETWATAILLMLGGAIWLWRKQSKFEQSHSMKIPKPRNERN